MFSLLDKSRLDLGETGALLLIASPISLRQTSDPFTGSQSCIKSMAYYCSTWQERMHLTFQMKPPVV